MSLSEGNFAGTSFGRIFRSDPDAGQFPVLFADGATGGFIDSARYADRDKLIFTYHQVVKRNGFGAWLLPNSTRIMESPPVPKSLFEWAVANGDVISLLFERGPITLPITPEGRILINDVRLTEPRHEMSYLLFERSERDNKRLQTELAKVRFQLNLSQMENERLNRERAAHVAAITGKSLMDMEKPSESNE